MRAAAAAEAQGNALRAAEARAIAMAAAVQDAPLARAQQALAGVAAAAREQVLVSARMQDAFHALVAAARAQQYRDAMRPREGAADAAAALQRLDAMEQRVRDAERLLAEPDALAAALERAADALAQARAADPLQ